MTLLHKMAQLERHESENTNDKIQRSKNGPSAINVSPQRTETVLTTPNRFFLDGWLVYFDNLAEKKWYMVIEIQYRCVFLFNSTNFRWWNENKALSKNKIGPTIVPTLTSNKFSHVGICPGHWGKLIE